MNFAAPAPIDVNYQKRQRVIRSVLDSFLRGCIIGNLIDAYRTSEGVDAPLGRDILEKIFAGEIVSGPSQNKQFDISWHYLFFSQIYSLLEYDSILQPHPLNFDANLKYLLVMRHCANEKTMQHLHSIFPEEIAFPDSSSTPEGNSKNGNKYLEALKQWVDNKQQFSKCILKSNNDPNTNVKFLLSQIIPILFVFSTNSLKQPVDQVITYLKQFASSDDYAPIVFYFVFMNKLLKYFLKESSIAKVINRIKTNLTQKKKYFVGKLQGTIEKFVKRIDKLKKLQKESKFASISDTSTKEVKELYLQEVDSLRKDKSTKSFVSFIMDLIILLLALLPIFDHNEILCRVSKITYAQSSIPALLLSLPLLAVFNPGKYSEVENQLCFKFNSANCLLNSCGPDPWFSTQVANQVFTEFVNLYSEKFYRKQ